MRSLSKRVAYFIISIANHTFLVIGDYVINWFNQICSFSVYETKFVSCSLETEYFYNFLSSTLKHHSFTGFVDKKNRSYLNRHTKQIGHSDID